MFPEELKCLLAKHAVWFLVVGVLIGLQLDPQVCSSAGAHAMSLFVGYVFISFTTMVLGGMQGTD